ncbi:MAG TPA: hypothetical protein VGJ28_12300 [Micromonosporaceae bacterium]|jgi:hypothetical protein
MKSAVRTLAVAGLILGLATACSKTSTEAGSSGLSGVSSSASAPGLPSGLPSAGPVTTPTGTKTTKPKTSKSPSAPPSPSTSPSAAQGDYKIVVWGPCYWALDSDDGGNVIVGTRFKIEFNGTNPPSTSIPVKLTNSIDVDNATSPGEPLNTVFGMAAGGPGTSGTYPGHTIKVTATMTPPSSDPDSSDNTASIGVVVPNSGLPTSTTPINIPCDASV